MLASKGFQKLLDLAADNARNLTIIYGYGSPGDLNKIRGFVSSSESLQKIRAIVRTDADGWEPSQAILIHSH